MRLSLTACLIITVVGEMITAQQGLGSTIIMAARSSRSIDLYGGIVLLGMVGAVNNALLGLIERALTQQADLSNEGLGKTMALIRYTLERGRANGELGSQ